MATRVFELARELGVTSKAILEKCRAEDLELKNHMAVLSAGLEATIREWFTEGAVSTAVETSQHVDLEQERQRATRQRRRRASGQTVEVAEATAVEEAATAAQAAPPEGTAAVTTEYVSETPQTAEQAAPAVAEAPSAEVAPETVVPAAESTSAEEEVSVQEAPAAVEASAPPVAEVHAPVAQGGVHKGPLPAKPEGPPKRAEVKPAGPQLVPRPAKMQGPRVVRMEKPDYVQAPPPRRRGPAAAAAETVAPATPTSAAKRGKIVAAEEEEEEGAKGKAKKRSPRRRGGRTAESGTVVEGIKEWRDRDLAERDQRLAAATSGTLRRHRASVSHGMASPAGPSVKSGKIQIETPITVKNLSAAIGVKSSQIIRKLMEMGLMVNVNQVLEQATAEAVALDAGIELEILKPKTSEELLVEELDHRVKAPLVTRAPVVTILGHVDHGKTSLLDRIRQTTVAAGEAGGITQHIGAYRYDVGQRHVVFLDTPGHEAFTAMRARGANMTDVVVLVVAADDGVMPQTVESISHARAAGVPIVVALNKVDVPNANIQRAMGQLAENGLNPREWGGEVEVIKTSAATGQGIEELVETLSLEAEILELKAEIDAPGSGFVVESKMDPGLGVVATLLVRSGTLKVGDMLLAGQGLGRVRYMIDSHGQAIDQAGPSTPVQVAGLDGIPEAGDRFYVVDDLEKARSVAADRRQRTRTESLAAVPQHTLESLLSRIEAGKATELALIIKADVQGSIEAIVNSLNKLSTAEVRVNVLHAAVGGISTGDVSLAEASEALIIGFNVVPDSAARQLADQTGVDIRMYRIIYDIIDDMRKALEEGLAPEMREQVLGHAEVRQVFRISRLGSIAGCFVIDGLVTRNARVRLTRNNIVLVDEKTLESLKRFKDDVREVRAGFECGLKIAGYDDIKEGDVLEFYQSIEVARKL